MSALHGRIPMWIDVDTGHDDAFALLLSAHSPHVNLLGVSTVHGNSSLEHTTVNTLGVLEAIGRRDLPVFPGSSKPLSRDSIRAAAIHGESGLGGVTLLPKSVAAAKKDVDFVDAMYKALSATEPNTAWLVTTGAMTNAAKLFIAHPKLAEHLGGVSIMAGALGGGFNIAPMGRVKGEGERFGNITPYAEFNVYVDPEAAKLIFQNPILAPKTTLIPLDVSHLCLATKQVQARVLYGGDSEDTGNVSGSTSETICGRKADGSAHSNAVGDSLSTGPTYVRAMFYQTLVFFAESYAEVFSLTEGPPLHDPLAVAAVIEPDLFDDRGGERFSVDVVITEGHNNADPAMTGELGRTVAMKLPAGEPGIRIPRNLDIGRFWNMVELALQEAEKVSPMRPLTDEEKGAFTTCPAT